jgi:diguanylate cyclase (GGDEF)-like protein
MAARRSIANTTRPQPVTPVRVWLLVVLVTGLAALVAGPALRLDGFASPHRLSWLVLAVLFYLAEANVVHVHVRRDAHSFSLSEVPLVLGLFFVSPAGLLGAQALGASAALWAHRRQRGPKLLFNVSQFALTTGLALVVFHRLVDAAGHQLSPEDWLAAMVAAFVGAGVGLVATQTAIAVSQGTRAGEDQLVQVLVFGLLAAMANASLGIVAVAVMWDRSVGYLLVVVPAGTLFLAYRAYVSERQKREGIETLYESTRLLQGSAHLYQAVEALLARVTDMVHAETAELVLFPGGDGSRALATTLRPALGVEPLRAVELDPADLVLASVAADRGGVLVRRRDRHTGFGGVLADGTFKDAMVVALQGDRGPVGLLRVANRLSDVSRFDRHDLRLLETLANHAGVSMENGHLAESLTELRARGVELEHQALFDPLTGLANRTLFSERLQQALSGRSQRAPAILFLDLDDFKGVNDQHGHLAGDRVLVEVARRVCECLRPGDTPARLGGDEFAVLLRDAESVENANRVAERIVAAMQVPVDVGGHEVVVGTSIGVALGPGPSGPRNGEGGEQVTTEQLLHRGDVAMYAAKARAKGSIVVFEPHLTLTA